MTTNQPLAPPRSLYSGTAHHPIYVDAIAPKGSARGIPVVMLHGGCHTGACYLITPDGRKGWAHHFAEAGHPVYVPDWPGHGRSPMRPDFHALSSGDVVEAVAALIAEIGPVILLAHSAAGPIAWVLAERLPQAVRAVIGVAPGAPANILPALPADPTLIASLRFDENAGCPVLVDPSAPAWIEPGFMTDYWANGDRFPKHAFEHYRRTIVPESPRIMNERFNIDGSGLAIGDPGALGDRPILVVTGSMDPRHPRAVDEATAAFLGAEFVWLADLGIHGNGHMMMIEDNSAEIARLLLDWIDRRCSSALGAAA